MRISRKLLVSSGILLISHPCMRTKLSMELKSWWTTLPTSPTRNAMIWILTTITQSLLGSKTTRASWHPSTCTELWSRKTILWPASQNISVWPWSPTNGTQNLAPRSAKTSSGELSKWSTWETVTQLIRFRSQQWPKMTLISASLRRSTLGGISRSSGIGLMKICGSDLNLCIISLV